MELAGAAQPGATTNEKDPVLSGREAAAISQRIERLPLTRWHTRVLSVVGVVRLTDAFDALTIAYVLPVLIGLWHLSPASAGLLVSAGYVGQTLGALIFSAAAERYGRLRALRWLLFILSIFSFASAQAGSLMIFAALRFVQGIGLGGESPVSATYMNELCPARMRGRFLFVIQSMFTVGNLAAAFAALWLIPTYGWQIMFYIGTLPVILALILPRLVPESPRWLAINGKTAEASRIVSEMEAHVPQGATLDEPPVAAAPKVVTQKESFRRLFSRDYVLRTVVVWLMACCSGLTTYGILVWLPALYRTVYHLPLDVSLRYGLFSMVATLLGAVSGIFLIDRLGRKKTFCLAFTGSALPMLYLAFSGTHAPAEVVAVLASLSIAFIAIVQCGIYVYAPELYPTRLRARGAGAAAAVTRLSSVFGPMIIGALLTYFAVEAVFAYLAMVALCGMVVIATLGSETRGKALDEISN